MVWRLRGHGSVEWSVAVKAATGLRCAWIDLDGFHLADKFPQAAPDGLVSLWASGNDRWLRGRVDRGALSTSSSPAVVLGELLRDPTDDTGEAVEVEEQTVLHWETTEPRLSERGRAARAQTIADKTTVLVVRGVLPVTFVTVPPN